MRICRFVCLLALVFAFSHARPVQAQNPFIGEIRFVAFNFAPQGWALCNGQTLSIAQNTALFTLLGTTYGGDGKTTFALPDLQGRVPLHMGLGKGLSDRIIGQTGGSEQVTLTVQQMPVHHHTLLGSDSAAISPTPGGHTLASNSKVDTYNAQKPSAAMNTASIASAGGGKPHPNMPPFLTLNCIIALQGIFPPRP